MDTTPPIKKEGKFHIWHIYNIRAWRENEDLRKLSGLLSVRGGVILDAVFTDERAAIFMACDGDEVIPYTIKI